RPGHHFWRPDAGANARDRLPPAAVRRREAARSDLAARAVGGVRSARDEAGCRWRVVEGEDLAGHRYRYPDRRERKENTARRCVRCSQGGVGGRRAWRAALPEVLGDDARQSPRGRPRGPGSQARLTRLTCPRRAMRINGPRVTTKRMPVT